MILSPKLRLAVPQRAIWEPSTRPLTLHSNSRDQNVEHRVPHLAMVLPEAKFGHIFLHVTRRQMNMRAAHAGLEQLPEVLHAVDVDPITKVIRDGVLLGTVIHSGVLETAIL
jgi:hypothetical protein